MPPKQKYRLQVVLNVREKAKDEAARTVALRRQQLAEAENELKRREESVENCRQQQKAARRKMSDEMLSGILAQSIIGHRNHLEDLKILETELQAAVEQQKKNIARAETEVENALAKLIETSKDLQVIETHKDNWQTQLTKENSRREQKLNDEIGAILYERRIKP